eukprot:CAMPEP_0202909774 /NCGR_PEP_ID=MMETSP1392-20130828/50264_1 /ASSEMBLY_ACC=CAM_ASM_000868 /TAXON_ID=225041 /ORGANISM="Chlamydomonas chlamydogama, Strain SAG 11-48b" /LENGTH=127 /DNA_ID=CAMNT_0049599639 /DNA_START=406 /DNA_END=790 /DNA_ORIENTATION=+
MIPWSNQALGPEEEKAAGPLRLLRGLPKHVVYPSTGASLDPVSTQLHTNTATSKATRTMSPACASGGQGQQWQWSEGGGLWGLHTPLVPGGPSGGWWAAAPRHQAPAPPAGTPAAAMTGPGAVLTVQ